MYWLPATLTEMLEGASSGFFCSSAIWPRKKWTVLLSAKIGIPGSQLVSRTARVTLLQGQHGYRIDESGLSGAVLRQDVELLPVLRRILFADQQAGERSRRASRASGLAHEEPR